MALEVISKASPAEMMSTIASKASAKATWDSITLHNVSVNHVRKVKVGSLKCKFDSLTFNDGESVDDFDAHIGWITNQLAILGFKYREEEIVRRFLRVLPLKFEKITTSIKTLLDLETITVDELIGCLKPSEERINSGSGKNVASLNLMEDELVAHVSSRVKLSGNNSSELPKESSSSGSKRGPSMGHGLSGHRGNYSGGNADGHGGDSAGCDDGRSSGNIMSDECHYCGKCGHWAHECRKKKKDEEVHVA
jgi:hypothetical protein